MLLHRHYDLPQRGDSVSVLLCCLCSEPAVRKCLGILDENQIDSLLGLLQRSRAEGWSVILQRANVGGEKKLSLMLEALREVTQNAILFIDSDIDSNIKH